MKTIFTMTFALLISNVAAADLSVQCKAGLNKAINDANEFKVAAPGLIAKGELTAEGVESLNDGYLVVGQVAALACRAYRLVELQRSQEMTATDARAEGDRVYNEALNYYIQQTK